MARRAVGRRAEDRADRCGLRDRECFFRFEEASDEDDASEDDVDSAEDGDDEDVRAVTLLDLLFEFGHAYGGIPGADFSWILFTEGLKRLGAFDARRLLEAMIGTRWGAVGIFGDASGTLGRALEEVQQLAWGAAHSEHDGVALIQDPEA